VVHLLHRSPGAGLAGHGGGVLGLVLVEAALRYRDGGAPSHLGLYVADEALGVRLVAGSEQTAFGGGDLLTGVDAVAFLIKHPVDALYVLDVEVTR